MSFLNYRRRVLAALAAFGLAGALGACENGLLEVKNPGAVNDADLDDPLVQQQIVNTVVGSFQTMYDDLVFAGALLSDEGVNGHNFTQWIEINLRVLEESNSILGSDIYGPLQRARAAGDNLSQRLRGILGDKAGSDLGLARALAYAGYGNIMLAEYFCESPVADDQPALSSDDIMRRAIGRFDEAIQIATAARANAAAVNPATTASRAAVAGADSIANMARVGAARASLWLGDKTKAVQYASAVPASFVMWLNYSDNKAFQENRLFAATSGSGRYLGVSAKFRNLNDPRIRHNATAQSGHSPDAILFTPRLGPSHTGWSAAAAGEFAKNTGIRLSSGLEAQYIVAEAQGPNAANIAFVNSRRAVGGQAALAATVSPADFLAALREQRSRDFFMDGHRLGDLRRYKKQYGVDEFNKGTHPVAKWGNYGTAECFPPSLAERIGNPAY